MGIGGKQGYSPFSIHVCVVSRELPRTDFTSRRVRTAAKENTHESLTHMPYLYTFDRKGQSPPRTESIQGISRKARFLSIPE